MSRRWPRTPIVAVAVLAGACAAGGQADEPSVPASVGTVVLSAAALPGCEALQQRHCLLPFPSDALTEGDAETDSGRRIAFGADALPANVDGIVADPAELNRNDGFSPGTPILISAPGVDLVSSGVTDLTDLAASTLPDAPTLLIDAETGELHPHWVELDSRSDPDDDPLMIVRTARNLREGHRYLVAVRGLRDSRGDALAPPEVFVAYRDRLDTDDPLVEARRPAMETVFTTLDEHGMDREDLWLAWDFTVASTRNLSERALTIRDDAMAELDGGAPTFSVDRVQPGGVDRTAAYVYGTFEVPNYLTDDGSPGNAFNTGPDGLPVRSTTHPFLTAEFACIIPTVATSSTPARPVVYGHGLLGTRFEVVEAWDIVLMTSEHDMVYCGTDWIGMTFDDATTVGVGLVDLTNFPRTTDRLQQSFVNTQYLARLLRHPDGFASDPAFRDEDGPLIDGDVFYDGNSQGGILGGAATALSVEWTRAVLGVPGMNFSLLLDRSLSFERFRPLLEGAYPDDVDRHIVVALVQMLWDRGEANGYAAHLADNPLPGTPAHQVLLHVAFGDFQVADIAAFNEARTMGAGLHTPVLADGRAEIDYTFGLAGVEYPWSGSAIVLWDSGAPAPPTSNLPPDGEGDPAGRHDPHSDPRYDEDARRQKGDFLSIDGVLTDVCGGPCTADRWG